jgi:exodeoxyribonuclease V alpha subunit
MNVLNNDVFSHLDRHFAGFIAGFGTRTGPAVALAAALLSRAAGAGNVCLDLGRVAGRTLDGASGGREALLCPPLADWLAELRGSPAVGRPGERRPLILDGGNRLYLHRYWAYEDALARDILARARAAPGDVDREALGRSLATHFPPVGEGTVDWQKAAAVAAVLKRFSVITGGPGTGKTFTIARLLAVLAEQPGAERLRVRLAAPTGKAAARLREALAQARGTLGSEGPAADAIPGEVHTVHRLLRPLPDSPYFRHRRENPLALDVLVIDEASMVDLALMAKLLDALPAAARLILVGDKDQLASVEAGSVLGDICSGAHPDGLSPRHGAAVRALSGGTGEDGSGGAAGLQDVIVELRQSFRFAPGSPIGELGRAVNLGDVGRVVEILGAEPSGQAVWLDPENDPEAPAALEKIIAEGYAGCGQAVGPEEALAEHGRFKILCAHRVGPFGSDFINRLAERVLSRHRWVRPDLAAAGSPWYAGRPVLITRNDYALELFNGDIGVTLAGAVEGGGLSVFFPAAAGGTRRFSPYRLPEHETVYAMTVHKSQGSEFEHILLVLPRMDSPILTRELLYTALTRARRTITVWGSRRVLEAAVGRRVDRTSGLQEALWGRIALES